MGHVWFILRLGTSFRDSSLVLILKVASILCCLHLDETIIVLIFGTNPVIFFDPVAHTLLSALVTKPLLVSLQSWKQISFIAGWPLVSLTWEGKIR